MYLIEAQEERPASGRAVLNSDLLSLCKYSLWLLSFSCVFLLLFQIKDDLLRLNGACLSAIFKYCGRNIGPLFDFSFLNFTIKE